jgi:hypothetical protein
MVDCANRGAGSDGHCDRRQALVGVVEPRSCIPPASACAACDGLSVRRHAVALVESEVPSADLRAATRVSVRVGVVGKELAAVRLERERAWWCYTENGLSILVR